MAETSIRVERRRGFTVLPNAMLRDPALSLKTKGLMAVLLGLPEDWRYSISGLAQICGTGKETIRSALRELEEAGYLQREQTHGEGGKFGGNSYVVHEEPLAQIEGQAAPLAPPLSGNPTTGKPMTEKPTSGKPSSENRTQYNKDIYNKQESITPLPPKGEEKPKRKSKYALAEDAKPILRAYVGSDQELARKLAEFIEIREAKRAINSPAAIRALLKRLDELSCGHRGDKLLLLEESISNSWKSVFPLKRRGSGERASTAAVTVLEEEGTYVL